MNLSQTRPNLTKLYLAKWIQANLNQTKLKQTKQHHTNVTEIQASPSHQLLFVKYEVEWKSIKNQFIGDQIKVV